MKLTHHVVIGSAALAIVIAACANDSSSPAPDTRQAFTGVPDSGSPSTNEDAGTTPGPTCQPPPTLPECSDGQVVAILHASSTGEVKLAQSVVDRLSDAAAKAFAQQMITDHSADDAALMATATASGISPIDNGLSSELTDAVNQEIEALSSKTGSELDRSYIRHEVFDHVQDLGVADHILAPSIKDPALAAAAAKSRALVATHAEKVVSVLAGLEGSCGGHETDAQ